MTRILKCLSCRGQSLEELLDFGGQVVSHHFLKSATEKEQSYGLRLGICTDCATVQLTQRIPAEELVPRYDWLTCTEPEAHLDRLVEELTRLEGITTDSVIAGISFKDDSTLDRFRRAGYQKTWRADPREDLGIYDPNAGVETIQYHVGAESAKRMVSAHGRTDLLIARHIIEHAYDLRQFIESCKTVVRPGGYLVFEIPDCQRAFKHYDYTTVWEQHTVYFTGVTFRNFFRLNGMTLLHFEHMPYSIEDSYVGVAKVEDTLPASGLSAEILAEELSRARSFAQGYTRKKEQIVGYLADYRSRHGKMALFGGGHMSCMFLNLFGLKDYFEFVVDDNPRMRGLFMPGSRLPVMDSQKVYDENIKLCVMTLSAPSEEKVLQKNRSFLEKGGEFRSVFPGSRWAMGVEAEV